MRSKKRVSPGEEVVSRSLHISGRRLILWNSMFKGNLWYIQIINWTYCVQCILAMQINTELLPPRFVPLPPHLPRSLPPVPWCQAPDSMSSPWRSASDFFQIKDFLDGLRKWYGSAPFDTEKVHYNVKWNRVPWLHSRAKLFATPWTVTLQAPLSMEFSRQEYCSG